MEDLTKKALLVKVSTHKISFEKKERQVNEDIARAYSSDKNMLNTKKSILMKENVKNLKKVMNKIMPTVYIYSLPWRDGGWRLLPVTVYERFEEEMRNIREELEEAKTVFANNYEKYKENARNKLGKLYNPLDYPPIEEILRKFTFYVYYEPVPTSNDIRVEMSRDVVENLKEQLEKTADEKLKRAMEDVWERVTETLNRLYERLSAETEVDENGKIKKPRIFKSVVENVRELISLLPTFNLTNDPKLEKIRKQLDENFASLTVEDLKEDEELKKEVAKKAKEIIDEFELIM